MKHPDRVITLVLRLAEAMVVFAGLVTLLTVVGAN